MKLLLPSTRRSLPSRQSGLSLVELMISLTLGLILMAALTEAYLTSKQVQSTDDGLLELQDSARNAIDILAYDIRSAGFAGCALKANGQSEDQTSFTDHTGDLILATDLDNFKANSVQGFNYSVSAADWEPALSTDIQTATTGRLVGNDILGLYLAEPSDITLNSAAAIGDTSLSLTGECTSVGDVVLLSNCTRAEISSITGAGTCPTLPYTSTIETTSGGGLVDNYESDLRLYNFKEVIFYVASTGRLDASGNSINALYRSSNGQPGVELIPGVENMQVLYGQKTGANNSALRYVTANVVGTDWDSVVSVQISLLVKSDDNGRTDVDTDTYSVADLNIGPSTTPSHSGGRTLRKVYSRTIQIRNRN